MARASRGAVLAALLAWGAPAHAQTDKRACLATYVEAQSNRQAGRLLAARAAAVTCGSESCPDVLRGDCVNWLRELDASIPTVVFSASTREGRDVTDARVTVDGHAVATRTAGEAIAMDPGEHVVACEADGYARVELHLVAAQGAKNRAVHFEMDATTAPAPRVDSPARPPGGARPPDGARPIRPLTYVLGAAGIVALGVWGGVGASALWGSPSVETLDRCKPNCSPGDRSDVQRKLDAADIAGGAALLTLGGALVVYLTRPVVVVAPLRGGAIAAWTTRF
jgi:hypothetical protein